MVAATLRPTGIASELFWTGGQWALLRSNAKVYEDREEADRVAVGLIVGFSDSHHKQVRVVEAPEFRIDVEEGREPNILRAMLGTNEVR